MSVSRARKGPILAPMLILLPPSEKKAADPGPAITVYIGVLYAALDWQHLNKAAQKRGQASIAIISARYGLVRPLDEIRPYKEKINTKKMRKPISAELDAIDADLIIDCRSSTYQGVWTPPAQKCVEIKIFTYVDGVKKTITHMSKKTRGAITRLLLQSKNVPRTPQELYEIISSTYECELIQGIDKNPWVLKVIAQ